MIIDHAGVARAGPGVETGAVAGTAESLADVIEWLFLVFEGRLGLAAVLSTVQECARRFDVDHDANAIKELERKRSTG